MKTLEQIREIILSHLGYLDLYITRDNSFNYKRIRFHFGINCITLYENFTMGREGFIYAAIFLQIIEDCFGVKCEDYYTVNLDLSPEQQLEYTMEYFS